MKRLSAGPLFFLPLLVSCQMTSETPLEPNARTLVRSPQGDPHAALPMSIPAVAWSRDISAPGYVDGAPIGGFGAGTITMRYDGGFYTGRLKIGNNDLTVDASSGFHLYQKPEGQPAVTRKLDAATLGSGQARYSSLFPVSWTDYSGSLFTVKAKVKQFSPIIPHDYQRTSYPVGVYLWELSNPSGTSCEVAVMLSWNNAFGGSFAEPYVSGSNKGVVLRRSGSASASSEGQGEFALASQESAGVSVSYSSAANTSSLVSDFSADGLLSNTTGGHSKGAVAFKTTLAAHQTITVPIVLSWDIPLA